MAQSWFVSRHAGARQWLERQGWSVDHQVAHLEPLQVQAGDRVYGSLPVHLAAALCARGAHYYHLMIELPAVMRGRELSADEMAQYGARLLRFECVALGCAP